MLDDDDDDEFFPNLHINVGTTLSASLARRIMAVEDGFDDHRITRGMDHQHWNRWELEQTIAASRQNEPTGENTIVLSSDDDDDDDDDSQP